MQPEKFQSASRNTKNIPTAGQVSLEKCDILPRVEFQPMQTPIEAMAMSVPVSSPTCAISQPATPADTHGFDPSGKSWPRHSFRIQSKCGIGPVQPTLDGCTSSSTVYSTARELPGRVTISSSARMAGQASTRSTTCRCPLSSANVQSFSTQALQGSQATQKQKEARSERLWQAW